ncbi:hypothetical protein [Pseudoalteromonas sp.]|uniref:hypothetical protein n=1 Tax=Pseudoalteromonas sp. TaxID=53249 RepID=UPI00356A21B8
MHSKRFLIVILLVLVHSFISCDGAAYHLQQDVKHLTDSQLHTNMTADENLNEAQAAAEIHAHQHCHCGYNSTVNQSINPEQRTPAFLVRYCGLIYPPMSRPPISLS